jgi:hypothetical protein
MFWKFEAYTDKDIPGCYHSSFETEEEAKAFVEKANKTFYLSYYDNDEIKEWFDKVDFTPVFEKVEELLGMKLNLQVNIRTNRHGFNEYFEIHSEEDLVDYFPILKAAWKRFVVDTFNAHICVDKETGELKLFGNMHFSYEHNDGGTNGANLFDFSFSNSDGFKIYTYAQR